MVLRLGKVLGVAGARATTLNRLMACAEQQPSPMLPDVRRDELLLSLTRQHAELAAVVQSHAKRLADEREIEARRNAEIDESNESLNVLVRRLHKKLIVLEAKSEAKSETQTDEVSVDVKGDEEQMSASFNCGSTFNIFSFSLEGILDQRSSWRRVARCVLHVTVLAFIQLVFAWGVFDVSRLDSYTNQFNAFNSPVSLQLFYPANHVGNGVPTINVVASLVAIYLLSYMCKTDTEGTLLSPCPLETLLLPLLRGDPRTRPSAASSMPAVSKLVRGVSLVMLQLVWCVRAAIVGPLCLIGAANIFASSNDALDIVLNSCAVGQPPSQ